MPFAVGVGVAVNPGIPTFKKKVPCNFCCALPHRLLLQALCAIPNPVLGINANEKHVHAKEDRFVKCFQNRVKRRNEKRADGYPGQRTKIQPKNDPFPGPDHRAETLNS